MEGGQGQRLIRLGVARGQDSPLLALPASQSSAYRACVQSLVPVPSGCEGGGTLGGTRVGSDGGGAWAGSGEGETMGGGTCLHFGG